MSQPTVLFCTRPAKMPDYRKIDRWQVMSDGTVRFVGTDGIIEEVYYSVQELFKDLNSGVNVYCEDKDWVQPVTLLYCARTKSYPDVCGYWQPGKVDRIRVYANKTITIVNSDGIETDSVGWDYALTTEQIHRGHWIKCEDKNWEAPPVLTASQWFKRWEETMYAAPLGSFCKAFPSIQVKDGTMRVQEKKLDDKLNAIVISIISPAGEVRHYSRIDGHWRRVDTPLTVREMLDKWEEAILQENSNKRFKTSDFPQINCANGFVIGNVWDNLLSLRLYGMNTKHKTEEHHDYSVCFDGWRKIAK